MIVIVVCFDKPYRQGVSKNKNDKKRSNNCKYKSSDESGVGVSSIVIGYVETMWAEMHKEPHSL